MPQREDKSFTALFKRCRRDCPYTIAGEQFGMEIASILARNEKQAASVLAHHPAHPARVWQSKEKTMTQLVPESWQQTLGMGHPWGYRSLVA